VTLCGLREKVHGHMLVYLGGPQTSMDFVGGLFTTHMAGFNVIWGEHTPGEVFRCDCEVGDGTSGDWVNGIVPCLTC
jgi:hypothetical protein